MAIKTFDGTKIPTTADGGAALAAFLREMRADSHFWQDEVTGAYHVLGYAQTRQILHDPTHFSSDFSHLVPESTEPGLRDHVNLGTIDPPKHRKYRSLVNQAFTPKVIAGMESRMAAVTDRLLGALDGLDEFDLVTNFASPLPAIVTAELLGVPAEDHSLFRTWAQVATGGAFDNPIGELNEVTVPDSVSETFNQMREYLLEVAKERRKDPRNDLISRMIAAEIDGERLSDAEVYGLAASILIGGQVSTTVLLGNALVALGERPDAERDLRADRSLIPGFLDETLRYYPPVVFAYRLAKNGAELDGTPVTDGTPVISWVMSANRDEATFPHGETFDLRRDPNPHLSFGHGIHYCLGAPVLRMESRIAVAKLLERYATIECRNVDYHETPGVLGVRSIDLVVGRA
ncbi:cytochrome P450 [Streptomyces celluloflavus]|uniref:cytochrome P450 n=1 Tax=Streptomyces celluloflavus TaxID=58344 RepID=UPI0036513A33